MSHTDTAFVEPLEVAVRRAMRVSVCNWLTGQDDVARTIAAVARAIS